MEYISASILRLDLADAGLNWTALDGVFHAMVRGCVWLDSAVAILYLPGLTWANIR